MDKKYKKLKKKVKGIEDDSYEFNGDRYDPMKLMKQSMFDLNYQSNDFKRHNESTFDKEKEMLKMEVQRMKEDENKHYWKNFYKDKY